MTEERQNAGEGGKSGQLKIFFGYAAGVGKTYAMLQAALMAEERGMDVVIGSIAPYRSLEDTALAERLRAMERLEKFDLDQAIRRKPDLILMDDLACENPPLQEIPGYPGALEGRDQRLYHGQRPEHRKPE